MLTATIVTTGIFTMLHGGAVEAGIIPVLNVLTMSVFMTVLLEWTTSIWAPIMAHYLWNAVGSLVFNVVLLADDYPHIFTAVFLGNDIISGGVCRIEGSIWVLIVNSIFCVLIGFLSAIERKRTVKRHFTDTVAQRRQGQSLKKAQQADKIYSIRNVYNNNDYYPYYATYLSSTYCYNSYNQDSYTNNIVKFVVDVNGGEEPAIVVTPNPIDLGARPNGYWMRPIDVEVASSGGVFNIAAIEVEDPYFTLPELDMPTTLISTQPISFDITHGEGYGDIAGRLVIAFSETRDVELIDMTAFAYDLVRLSM